MRAGLLLLYYICCIKVLVGSEIVSSDNGNLADGNDSVEEFKPTHEWQTIKRGQTIPKGLHVRINLQTGEKEAKLLSDQSNKKTDILTINDDTGENDNVANDRAEAVRESLLKLEANEKGDEIGETIREKFRTYKELKEAFNELNMTVKTDLEIIHNLVNKFQTLEAKKQDDSYDEKLLILTDLEYLVHQFDNALEFVKLDGVTDIVLPMMNSSEPKLRAEAVLLLGSAAQSNVKVQIAGLENGAIGSLLKVLWLDSDVTVQMRSVYALSCLIRNFPTAQAMFVKEGGVSALAHVFEKERENHRLQIKIITLLYDLLLERQDTQLLLSEERTTRKELQMKMNQYKSVGLEDALSELGWCTRTAEILLAQDQNWSRTKKRDDLLSAMTDLPARSEHDFVEKAADALLAMADICHKEFKSNEKLKKMVRGLKDWYNELAVKESLNKAVKHSEESDKGNDPSYYSGIAHVLEQLSKKLDNSNAKDEL